MGRAQDARTASEGGVRHTPGPWKVDRHQTNGPRVDGVCASIVRGDLFLAEVWADFEAEENGDGDIAKGTGLANARLMAAAPELLELLITASHALKSYMFGNASPELAAEVAYAADVVIAKATGQPPNADAVREDVGQPIVPLRDQSSSSSEQADGAK